MPVTDVVDSAVGVAVSYRFVAIVHSIIPDNEIKQLKFSWASLMCPLKSRNAPL